MMGTTGRCSIVPEDIADGIMDSHLIRLRFADGARLTRLSWNGSSTKAITSKSRLGLGGKGTIRWSGLNSSIIKDIWVGLPNRTTQAEIVRHAAEATEEGGPIGGIAAAADGVVAGRGGQRSSSWPSPAASTPTSPSKSPASLWLRQIPKHWQLTRAKFVSEVFVPQRNKPELNQSEGHYWVTMDEMARPLIDSAAFRVSEEAMVVGRFSLTASG